MDFILLNYMWFAAVEKLTMYLKYTDTYSRNILSLSFASIFFESMSALCTYKLLSHELTAMPYSSNFSTSNRADQKQMLTTFLDM